MLTGLPKDPVILLSVVNTKLRDYYRSLDELEVDKNTLIQTLKNIDYEYDDLRNQFV